MLTKTQERHFGRAAALAIKLAQGVEGLYWLRSDLFDEVYALTGNDSPAAERFVVEILRYAFPTREVGPLLAHLLKLADKDQK